MSDIDFDDPLVFPSHSGETEELLYCYYGVDNWKRPTKFTVRLQQASHRREDGKLVLKDVARFDHNGHSAFEWNPATGDGFHIDVYPNGEKEKVWLATPPAGVNYDVLNERYPPSERIHATMEYCRDVFVDDSNRAYLLQVRQGQVEFEHHKVGLAPPSSIVESSERLFG
ncbi:hypothetical protein [Halorussus lipolyticus]|uniref:hypothetical protein n=1 Tax=Halorussus lipolyticus TaxID=3034024 RepID=UPI0023E8730E|nr:hypothetical protein [Halorussus sp. DT80]